MNGIWKPSQSLPVDSVATLKTAVEDRLTGRNPARILDELEGVAEFIISHKEEWNPHWGNLEEALADARRIRTSCLNARHAMEGGNVGAVASFFYELGQLSVILQTRPYEAYVDVGRKSLDRDNKGGAPKKPTPAPEQLAKEVEALVRAGIEPTEARTQVASTYQTSEATIRRRLKESGLS